VPWTFFAAGARTDIFLVSHKSFPFIYSRQSSGKTKSEIRISKSETNPKSELHPRPKRTGFEFVMFGSFENCFEFRISSFEFVQNLLLSTPLFLCRFFDGFNDLHVAGAHTKIAGQCSANLFFGRIRITLQKSVAGYDHSRGAVTALKSVVFEEGFLYRAQLTVLCQTFDRGEFTAIRLHREVETGFDDFAIEQHGAGAALADDAADVSASETDVLAQEVRQE